MMRRLLSAASFLALSAAASRGTMFIGVMLIAHLMGPVAFGQFSLIQTTALLFTTFCALSLGQMATKIVAEAVAVDSHRVSAAITVSYGSAIIVALAFALPILIFARPLAARVGDSPSLASAYVASSLLIVTGYLIAVQNGVALALEAVRRQAYVNVLVSPLVLICIVIGARYNDINIALYGYIAAQFVVLIGQETVLWRQRRRRKYAINLFDTKKEDWSVLWRLGLPSSLAGLLTLPATWFSMVILAHGVNGHVELGNFALGNQVRSILMFGMGVIANATLPMLSVSLMRGDVIESEKTLIRSIALVVSITLFISVIVAASAPLLIRKFAPAYEGSIAALLLLLLAALITAPTTIFMRKATAEIRPGVLLIANMAFACSLTTAGLVAQQLGAGATGLAFAFVVASAAQLIVFYMHNRSELRAFILRKNSP